MQEAKLKRKLALLESILHKVVTVTFQNISPALSIFHSKPMTETIYVHKVLILYSLDQSLPLIYTQKVPS